MNNKAGYYRTNLKGIAEYKSYVPSFLPVEIDINQDIINELSKANRSLGELDSRVSSVPDIKLLIAMYVRKEALLSSQIEGTQATLEDIFDPTIDTNINKDVEEVINYIKAIYYAIDRINQLPLCNRLFKEIHQVLLANARGSDKYPGEYRRTQNWIGSEGSTIQNARYVPPNPEDMEELMSNLEGYINDTDELDPLIKIALIHYQFETIHPFLDGNGRVGRLLVLLYLLERKIISAPVLYISYYLKLNRIEYSDRLSEVREKGNYEQWILFFLKAIHESCENTSKTIDLLDSLRRENLEKINKLSKNAKLIFKYLESNPIIDIGTSAKELKVSYNTVSNALSKLMELGIVEKLNDKKRDRLFIYKKYLDILRTGTEL